MAGMGKRKVEIDFTKGRNKKILLIGDNGSGKTIIVSSATPYRETNDNRKVTPLDGETGIKEIHYRYGKNFYEITHYYGETSAKNKSYVKKNGKELNDNGNIRPFNDIIEEELDINSDYFAVGRLGSNVSNFIDYSTAERKRYINKFIPNIDEYTEAYDIVNTKLNDINKRLKSIELRLEKYNSLDELKESRNSLQNTIDNINKNINSNSTTLEQLEEENEKNLTRLKEIEQELVKQGVNIDGSVELADIVNESRELLNNYQEKVNTLRDRFPKLFEENPEIQDLKNRIPNIEARIEIHNSKIEASKSTININKQQMRELTNSSKDKKDRIDSFAEENIEDLEKILKGYEDKKYLSETEKDKIIKIHNEYNFEDSKLLNENFRSKLANMADSLQDRHSNHEQTKFEADDIMIERYGMDMDNINTHLNNFESDLESITLEGNQLSHDLQEIRKSTGLLDILESSEHHEHAEDCPFVPMALDFKNNDYASIGEMEKRFKELETEHARFTEEVEDITNYKNTLKRFTHNIIGYFLENEDEFSILGITNQDILDLFSKNFFAIEKKLEPLPVYLDYNLIKGEIAELDTRIDNIKEKIEYNQSFQKTIQDYLEDIESNSKRISEMEDENEKELINIDEFEDIVLKSSNTLKIINLAIEYRTDEETQLEMVKIYDEYRVETNELTENISERTEKVNKLLSDNKILANDLGIQKETLDKVNREFYIVESSLQELNNINEVLDYFKTIKDSLDIKKGIPLIFTNTYLLDIAERTNELLSIAYDDAFSIEFEVTKRDFNIIVNKDDGTSLDDISLASQGETAMTNTSLSLAMMANVTEGYNILYLDEVDSTLDDNNRRSFLSVLDKQIENLNSQQTFIISHNNEFYSADVDLILLKGYQSKININDDVLMGNKKILYQN